MGDLIIPVNSGRACILCLEPATKKCTACKDAVYCSVSCQKADWHVHRLLCKKFQQHESATRPSNTHTRAILFPESSLNLEFVWVPADPSGPGGRDCSRFAGGAKFTAASEFDNFSGSAGCTATQQIWFVHDPKYPRSKDKINRAILNLGPPGLAYPWCGPVLACGSGDICMRDFRAIVDWFALHPSNKALLDPFRYFGPTVQGVRCNSESMMKAYHTPELEVVHMTKSMASKAHRLKLQGFSKLMGLPIAWHTANGFPGAADPYTQGDPNGATYIIQFSQQLEAQETATKRDRGRPSKAFGDLGTVIYSRLDDKPVHMLHVEAWHEFLFYFKSGKIGMAAVAEHINKTKFLEFWPKFLLRHQLVECELDKKPSPYDV